MPTANRRRFVPGAIAQFLAQDYADAELVILDDGEDSVADLIPQQSGIRYLRTPLHQTLGASGADACGIDRALFVDPRVPAAWEYIYPPSAAPWVYGAALCYRRDFWSAHPYANITAGEDTRF